jgi:hypothetical protein
MKRLATTLAVMLLTVFTIQAQSYDSDIETSELPKTVFGIKSGVNISRLSASSGAGSSDTRTGLSVGIFVRKAITEEAFLRPEMYYSSQGSPSDKIDYLNIPIILEYGHKFSFQIGAQLGVILNASSNHFKGNLKDELRPTDLSLLAGFGFSPGKHFTVGVRYNIGFNDIVKSDDGNGAVRPSFPTPQTVITPTIHNRVMHFYVGWAF